MKKADRAAKDKRPADPAAERRAAIEEMLAEDRVPSEVFEAIAAVIREDRKKPTPAPPIEVVYDILLALKKIVEQERPH